MQEKNITSSIFSETLRARMREMGLTQVQLAALVGMSQPGVGRYLRGNIPSADNLYALSQALGMTMEKLLTGGDGEGSREAAARPATPGSKPRDSRKLAELKKEFEKMKAAFNRVERLLAD